MTALELERRALEARDRATSFAVAVPAWAWVALLVLVSAGLRAMLGLRDHSPWIFQDELLYSELARSFGTTGHFAVRETAGAGGFGFVYPALVSPAWALFDHVPAAYAAAKVINSFLMSLAAVPVYLLTRRLAGQAFALLAAVLALALPSMIYTSTIMTENVFYPVFLFWVLAVFLALERPTILRQLAAVGLTFVAYETRNQGAVLAPALVTAIVVFVLLEAWDDERGFARGALRRTLAFAATWVALAAAAALFFAVEVGSKGKTFTDAVLGGYSVLTESSYSVRETLRWALYQVGELDLAVGILPFAAFIVLVAVGLRRKPLSREIRAFAVVALSATVWFALEVGAFSTTAFGRQIQERNLFYLEPLFLIALAVWGGRRLPWSPVANGAGALIAVTLAVYVPYGTFLTSAAVANAFGLLPLRRLEMHGWVLPSHLSELVTLVGLAGGLVFVLLPRRFVLVAPAIVLVYLAFMNSPVEGLTSQAARESDFGGIQNSERDWIDRKVGTKLSVAAVWSNASDQNFVTLWNNEFFNHSIGPVYNLAGPPDGLPQQTVTFDPGNGVMHDSTGAVVQLPYVLTDRALVFAGDRIASDEGTGMMLYRATKPIRLATQSEGIFHDSWSGSVVNYTIYDCRGGSLNIALLGDPGINPHRQKIVARDRDSGKLLARKSARPGRIVRFSVAMPPDRPVCRVSFSITPTAVPALTTKSGDTRVLGTRFLHPLYVPAS